jgi:hypothetical protein
LRAAPVHFLVARQPAAAAGVENEPARPHVESRTKAVAMTEQARKRSPSARADYLRLDARLDEALMETFPASDPIAVSGPTATERPRRPTTRRTPLPDLTAKATGKRAPRKRRATG